LLSLALVNGLATADTYAHRTLLGAVPPHARRPLAVGADQHHIAGRDGPRPLDHTALGVGARRAHVPLLDVDAFHDNPVLAGPRFEHPAGLALVVAAYDHHQVILFHMHFDRFRQHLASHLASSPTALPEPGTRSAYNPPPSVPGPPARRSASRAGCPAGCCARHLSHQTGSWSRRAAAPAWWCAPPPPSRRRPS